MNGSRKILGSGIVAGAMMMFGVYAMLGGVANEAQSTPAAGGGATYVAYGTTSCAAGFDVAYTGVMRSAEGFNRPSANAVALALSNTFCSAIPDGNYFSTPTNATRVVSFSSFPCAVCVK